MPLVFDPAIRQSTVTPRSQSDFAGEALAAQADAIRRSCRPAQRAAACHAHQRSAGYGEIGGRQKVALPPNGSKRCWTASTKLEAKPANAVNVLSVPLAPLLGAARSPLPQPHERCLYRYGHGARRRQKAEGRRQKAEGRRQKAEDSDSRFTHYWVQTLGAPR